LFKYKDWVEGKDVMEIIIVLCPHVKEMYQRGHSYKVLKASLSFNNAQYFLSTSQKYGHVKDFSLPSFDSPTWLLFNMLTTKTF